VDQGDDGLVFSTAIHRESGGSVSKENARDEKVMGVLRFDDGRKVDEFAPIFL
jgi:hypothetical protein